jgi:hypothetical protein
MLGMFMAENTVVLRHVEEEGRGRRHRECPSGLKIWRAEARVGSFSDRDRHPNRVSYTFRVH